MYKVCLCSYKAKTKYVKYPKKQAGSLEAFCSTYPISCHIVNIKAQLKM